MGPVRRMACRSEGMGVARRNERSEGPDEMRKIGTGSTGIDRSGVGLIYRY